MSKLFIGTVISKKMKKTIIVLVERRYRHPKYKKVITRHKRFKVHSEEDKLNIGDRVQISESKPISKEKHFIFIKKL